MVFDGRQSARRGIICSLGDAVVGGVQEVVVGLMGREQDWLVEGVRLGVVQVHVRVILLLWDRRMGLP